MRSIVGTARGPTASRSLFPSMKGLSPTCQPQPHESQSPPLCNRIQSSPPTVAGSFHLNGPDLAYQSTSSHLLNASDLPSRHPCCIIDPAIYNLLASSHYLSRISTAMNPLRLSAARIPSASRPSSSSISSELSAARFYPHPGASAAPRSFSTTTSRYKTWGFIGLGRMGELRAYFLRVE